MTVPVRLPRDIAHLRLRRTHVLCTSAESHGLHSSCEVTIGFRSTHQVGGTCSQSSLLESFCPRSTVCGENACGAANLMRT